MRRLMIAMPVAVLSLVPAFGRSNMVLLDPSSSDMLAKQGIAITYESWQDGPTKRYWFSFSLDPQKTAGQEELAEATAILARQKDNDGSASAISAWDVRVFGVDTTQDGRELHILDFEATEEMVAHSRIEIRSVVTMTSPAGGVLGGGLYLRLSDVVRLPGLDRDRRGDGGR